MISALAHDEMSTVILPVKVALSSIALLTFMGGMPLVVSAVIMRDSRDHHTGRQATLTFMLGIGVLVLGLVMAIALMFVYQAQGGFE